MNLSYSKVTTLQDCPRRFFYSYILKLEEEPQVINYGDLGSRAHIILEDFYKQVNMETDDIEKEFNSVLGKLYHRHFEGIMDPKGNFARGVRNFCSREIVRYNNLENKDLFKPRYSEIALEANIAGQHFRGRLDAVYTNPDGTLKLVDYKFTGSNAIKMPQQIQAVIYIEMMKQRFNIKIDEYYFWFMRHGMGKTGRGFEKVINVTNEMKKEVFDIIKDSAKTIEIGEYKKKDNFDFFCSNFCGYYGVCMDEMLGISDDFKFED